MIHLRDEDIGRSVLYRPLHAPHKPERGVITGFNSFGVFVRYGDEKHSKSTDRRDLEWEFVEGVR